MLFNMLYKWEVEDEIHFLLKCPQYKNIRDNLFTYATSIIPEFDDLSEIKIENFDKSS